MTIYKKNLIVPELSVPERILWAASAVGVTILFCLVPQKNPLMLIATIEGVIASLKIVRSAIYLSKNHRLEPLNPHRKFG